MSDTNENGAPPSISYTRKRTLTKTRTAASKARRRKNIPLVHASGGGGGGGGDNGGEGRDAHSWFARKSSGWTDAEIKGHLVSGGTAEGGKSFAMVGDVILGGGDATTDAGGKKKRKKKGRGAGGVKFAWEEDNEEEDGGGDRHQEQDGSSGYDSVHGSRMMTAAPPTLADIMDEQDKIDFMSPLQTSQQYQLKASAATANGDDDANEVHNKSNNNPNSKSRRQKNAALAELAQVSGLNRNSSSSKPTSANESVGWRLLRVWGYRSRLGVAFVPLSGTSREDAGVASIIDTNAILQELERDGSNKRPSHEKRWLASKRLRAIRLPSIQNTEATNDSATNSTTANKSGETASSNSNSTVLLTIPPPKMNRHGLGFDPFKNAPEFRAFHERRRAIAQKHGRDSGGGGGGQGGGNDKGDRYLTDDLRNDARKALWDKSANNDDGEGSDDDDDDDYPSKAKNGQQQHSHYAADRNYTDFIGTKASSGFALQDEDDANVYHDGDAFPNRGDGGQTIGGGGGDGGMGEYAMEVQSPVASDAEDDDVIHGGLFGKSAMIGNGRKVGEGRANKSEDKGDIVDAWSAWGTGSDNAAGVTVKKTTMDGKPPLSGFTLGHSNFVSNVETQAKADAPKRWKGPTPPTGYLLKRHIFVEVKYDNATTNANANSRMDSGLGLDLQRRQQQAPSRSFVPKVLPSSSGQRKLPSAGSEKMLAKDGSELNFHAVRESMKSRFVSSAGTDAKLSMSSDKEEDGNNKIEQDLDKEEWVQVTVASWIPTRLLCKRWGVPTPNTAGMSSGAEVGDVGKAQNKEEDYFRQTVYEPAVASMGPNNNGTKTVVTTKTTQQRTGEQQPLLADTFIGEGDGSDPPPTRPSHEVFQSIFDAESDMDISFSEDEDSVGVGEKDSNDDGNPMQPEKYTDEASAKITNSAEIPSKNQGIDVTDAKLDRADRRNDDGASSIGDSMSSDSQSSERKREIKRRWRGRHRRSHADSDDSHDDRTKRKRKEKHRSKSRSRRRDFSSIESDGEESNRESGSDDDDDDVRRRRKKKRHKHHRSRSRHRKRTSKI